MNIDTYRETRSLLDEAGLEISAERYDEAIFASWFFELRHEPPLRVVWDGRDGCYAIEWWEPDDGGSWRWVWVETRERTPREIVAGLARLRDFAVAARESHPHG